MKKNSAGIWITGASSGIGREAAIEFSKAGCDVFVSSRRETELQRLNKELKKEKLSVKVFPCNVASSANVVRTFKQITGKNKVDCLINNAGISSFKSVEEDSLTDIKDIVNANLLGSIYTIKNILPYFIEKGGGTIINIISVAAKKVLVNSSIYSATKAGLKAYTDVLREEVRKYNIRVINVFPGATATRIWPIEALRKNKERMMSPADVAQILVWLFLQKNNLVTEEITVKPVEGDI